jgi:hypothetical protein
MVKERYPTSTLEESSKSLHPIWRKKLKRCDAKGVKN